MVNKTAKHTNILAAEVYHKVRDENPNTKLNCGSLKPRGHIDVRRQVRGIDLELAANGTLNGPATVEPKAHLHAVVGHTLQHARVASVLREHWRLVDRGNDPDERHNRHVRQLRLPIHRHAGEAPDKEEGIADVLVGCAMVVINTTMDNLPHLVHKQHHLLFQNLRGIRETSNVAEADDCIHLLPWHHGVDPSTVSTLHVLPDDLSTCLAKAQCKETAQLDDGLLKDDRLHGSLHLFHLVSSVPEFPAPAALG
mmetsp:Transcript_43821/g.76977  ORF Transcript_43821/g.76977 Transcript_43821/m.76977 type:complete len:253 (-) Transcript_43821:2015-2773(-)